MWVRKFCMHYILNEQFWLNISRVISKSVRRELTFLVECISTSSISFSTYQAVPFPALTLAFYRYPKPLLCIYPNNLSLILLPRFVTVLSYLCCCCPPFMLISHPVHPCYSQLFNSTISSCPSLLLPTLQFYHLILSILVTPNSSILPSHPVHPCYSQLFNSTISSCPSLLLPTLQFYHLILSILVTPNSSILPSHPVHPCYSQLFNSTISSCPSLLLPTLQFYHPILSILVTPNSSILPSHQSVDQLQWIYLMN